MPIELQVWSANDRLRLQKFHFWSSRESAETFRIEVEYERDYEDGPGIDALGCMLVDAKCHGTKKPFRLGPARTLHEILKRNDTEVRNRAKWLVTMFGEHAKGLRVRDFLRASIRGKEPQIVFVEGSLDAQDIHVRWNGELVAKPTLLIEQFLSQWAYATNEKPSVRLATRFDLAGDHVRAMRMARIVREENRTENPAIYLDASIALGTFTSNAGLQDRALEVLQETLDEMDSLRRQIDSLDAEIQIARLFYHLVIARVRKRDFPGTRRHLDDLRKAITSLEKALRREEKRAHDGIDEPPKDKEEKLSTLRHQIHNIKVGACHQKGVMAREEGKLERAEELFRECIEMRSPSNGDHRIAFDIRSLARIKAMRTELDEAERLYDHAEQILKKHGAFRYIQQIDRERAAYFG